MLNTPSSRGLYTTYLYSIATIINPIFYTDELSISITSTPKPVISEGRSIQFIARATGITNKKKLMYHWQKNGRRNKLPDSALVINKTLLIIPTLMKADEGKYHCTVTNEWGNTEMSNVIKLTVIGNKAN